MNRSRALWIAIVAALLMQPHNGVRSQATRQPVVRSVSVHQVPHPVGRDFWDGSFIGNLLSGTPLGFQPDIRICLAWGSGRSRCTPVCQDSEQCSQPLGSTGIPLDPANPRLHVRILDDDPPGSELIADLPDVDPTACPDSAPCSFDVHGESVIVSFGLDSHDIAPQPAVVPPLATPSAAVPASTRQPVFTLEMPKDSTARRVKLADENIPTLSLKGTPFITGANDPCCVHENDVTQGLNGNCFLLSSLAAIARVSPGTISSAIKDNGNGTYDVTLYLPDTRGRLVPTIVSGLDTTFPRKDDWYATATDNPFKYAQPGDAHWSWLPSLSWIMGGFYDRELWVMLIEKAYAEMHGGYTGKSFGEGEASSYALQTITGSISERWIVDPNPSVSKLPQSQWPVTLSTRIQLDSFFTKNLANRHAIVVGTVPACTSAPTIDAHGTPTEQFRCTPPGDKFFEDGGGPLVRTHAYYVIGYAGGMLMLGNPWNVPVPPLTLDQFAYAFRQIHVSAPPPSACQCT